MIRVVKTLKDLSDVDRAIIRALDTQPVLVEYKPYKPPRTLRQSRKLHVMIAELGAFTGDEDMKGTLKTFTFWPEVMKSRHDGSVVIKPKSEADFSAEEESALIEALFRVGAEIEGFEYAEG